MLKIRLQRTGKRGQAYFRVVVLEHTTKPKGKYLEFLGSYDPHKNEISVKADRVKYWLSMGAQLSETANNLLVGRGVIEGEKVKAWKPKKKKKEKEAAQVKTAPAEKPQTEEATVSKENGGESKPAKIAEEAAPAPAEEAKTEQESAQPTP